MPVWHTLAENDFKDKVNLGRMDASANKYTASRFSINGFPVVVLVRNDSYFIFDGIKNWQNIRNFATTPTAEMFVPGFPVLQRASWTVVILDFAETLYSDLVVIISRRLSISLLIFFFGVMVGLMIAVSVLTMILQREEEEEPVRYKTD